MVIDGVCTGAFLNAKNYEIPFVMFHSAIPIATIGLLPTYYGYPGSGLPSFNMNVQERFQNIWYVIQLVYHQIIMLTNFVYFELPQTYQLSEIGMEDLDSTVYAKKSSAMIGASFAGIEPPVLMPPHLHLVGTILDKEQIKTPLDKPLKNWLNNKSNVIYINLGTISLLNEEQMMAITEGLKNRNVIWRIGKSQKNELVKLVNKKFGYTSNTPQQQKQFYITSWISSMYAVMNHTNVKIIFNHAGANTFYESIYFGKPQILFPRWLDTYDYAATAQDLKLGIQLRPSNKIPDASQINEAVELLLVNQTSSSSNIYWNQVHYWSNLLKNAGGASKAANIITNVVDYKVKAPSPLTFQDPHSNWILSIYIISTIVVFLIVQQGLIMCCSTLSKLFVKRNKEKQQKFV
jgi:polyene glycosyltransferase